MSYMNIEAYFIHLLKNHIYRLFDIGTNNRFIAPRRLVEVTEFMSIIPPGTTEWAGTA